MATCDALPATLRARLTALAWQIRRWQIVRGLTWLVFTLALTGGAILLTDTWLELGDKTRMVLLAVWLGLGAFVALTGLVLPLSRRLKPEVLAALVEEKYPELGERLTSTVELAETKDTFHGAPAFIALLRTDTEQRTQPLNFHTAVPGRLRDLLLITGSVVLLVGLPMLAWPSQYPERVRRFLVPWYTPPLYALAVTPGDAIAAQGRPLTLAVRVTPLADATPLPRSCTLVVTDAAGQVSRRRMTADQADAFSLQLDAVPGSFQYQVEIDKDHSATYALTAVEPVQLAMGSPQITLTPPAYARATVPVQTGQSVADLSLLQHGHLGLDLKFTRPAIAANVTWKAANGKTEEAQALDLSADRTGGRFEMPARTDGTFRLVLEAEHGIRTELDPWPLTVKKDQPPVFVKVAIEGPLQGKPDRLPAVLPYDSIPIAVQLADDVGIGAAELEYRINEGPARSEPMTLTGQGTQNATGRHLFKLAGKVQEGDTVRYRLKAADNRQVPEAKLGPNVVHHPDDSWLALKIARQAEPLKQQEILAQRDDVNRRLDALQKDLQRQQAEVSRLRKDSQAEAKLQPEQDRRLQQLKRDNQSSRNALGELARDLAPTPALENLANRAQAVADTELTQSAQALDQARKDTAQPATRNPQMDEAAKQLTAAALRLEEMRRQNDQQTQARLDQLKLEMTADRQQQLAERTAEQAARDPIKDPESPNMAKQLEREQAELAAELERLAKQSPALRQAMDMAHAEQARQLAQEAQKLAQAQRELAEASQETRAGQFADLARKQQELAEKAAELARATRQPAHAAKVPPLLPDDSQKAAAALEKGDPAEALKNQDQAAAELDRLARGLDQAIEQGKDPREAARQLARLQEGLRQQLAEETGKKNATVPLAQRLENLEREQAALQKAAEQISVPPALQAERQEAAARVADAADALQKQDPRHADARMTQARLALEKLAERLPALPQRQQQAQAELAQLRRQQDQIAAQAEKLAAKEDLPKQAELAQKQAAVAERLSKVDAPGQELRHEETQKALNKALADLMDGRRQDAPTSQQEAKRQLEKLEQALAGKKPAEGGQPMEHVAAKPPDQTPRQQAQELAKQQKDLAEAARQAAQLPGDAGKKALDQVAQEQQKLNEQASQLPANQAQQALEQARAVMNQAQQALAKNEAAPAAKKQDEAAKALENLARQLPDRQAASAIPTAAAAPQGLPQKSQGEQARQLAQAQRELRAEVQRLTNQLAQASRQEENPAAPLAKGMAEMARQASAMAQGQAKELGPQAPAALQAGKAAQSAEQAAKALQAGDLPSALAAGQQAAQEMQQLAKQLADSPAAAKQAAQLAQQMEGLDNRLEPLAGDAKMQLAQQQGRQQDLQKQAAELTQALGRLAQQLAPSPQAQQSAQQAAAAGQQAQAAMQQAQAQDRQGNPGQGQQAQQMAAQALERASQQAVQSAQQMTAGRPPQGNTAANSQTGQALEQAQNQMTQAQGQLAKNQALGAQASMERAAQALQQAAQQMAQQSGPASPQTSGEVGAAAGGVPDPSMLPKDLQQYAGKSWGELPGEVRSRILQDTRARYGDDYARIIKLYFEQMAETKAKPNGKR